MILFNPRTKRTGIWQCGCRLKPGPLQFAAACMHWLTTKIRHHAPLFPQFTVGIQANLQWPLHYEEKQSASKYSGRVALGQKNPQLLSTDDWPIINSTPERNGIGSGNGDAGCKTQARPAANRQQPACTGTQLEVCTMRPCFCTSVGMQANL